MRTILLAAVAVLGACATDPELPPAPPMPTGHTAVISDGSVPSTEAACLTRWRYPADDIQFDCSRTLVDGDPDHWVQTCNVPPGLGVDGFHGLTIPAARHEATTEDGFYLHELIELASMPTNYIPWRDVSYVYDSQHRLTEVQSVAPNGVDRSDVVIGPRDAQGNVLAIQASGPALVDPVTGQVYPATAHSSAVFQYDEHGRLVADQSVYSDGWKFWDETIGYDDRARRRDRAIIVDLSGEISEGGGAGLNTQHEFVDPAGRVLTISYTRPDGPSAFVVYRYDDQSRVSSKIVTIPGGFSSTTDYVYECQ